MLAASASALLVLHVHAGERNSNGTTDDDAAYKLPAVEVSSVAPADGVELDLHRIPANVQVLTRETFEPSAPLSLNEALYQRATGVTVSDAQNNPLQTELAWRGFSVSPLLGLPQGLALYQQGARINEPFGDAINFDMVPEFAIEQLRLVPGANPVYGLNALGGAILADMKSGFSAPGTAFEAHAGSFGRLEASAEHGAQFDDSAYYFGFSHFHEDGWRDHSDSGLQHFYSDFSYRGKRLHASSSVQFSEGDLNGNGAAPVELLRTDRSAVFTHPDNTRNDLLFYQLRGDYALNDSVSIQGNGYFRRLHRDTLNGDETDIDECAENPQLLCMDDGGGNPATTLDGGTIATDSVGEEPFAVFNRSTTETDGSGATLQFTFGYPLLPATDLLVVGAALDHGYTQFGNDTEIGTLTADRSVDPAGIFLGSDVFNTQLVAQNTYAGIYATHLRQLLPRLDLTLAARFNHARIELDDRRGDALDGKHRFDRLNPSVGITWRWSDSVSTYANYGETNRVPTPAELSCADPEQPCRFPHAFVADPPLEQVVARTLEAGWRGRSSGDVATSMRWSVAPFVTISEDDIVFVSSGPVTGSGYFENIGETRRAGIEAGITTINGRLRWFANYAYIRATFEDNFLVLSEHNPAANADGEVQVQPGDRMPGIPLHSAKLGISYAFTPRWQLALNTITTSSRVLRGDEGNDQPRVEGFTILNARGSYRLDDNLEAFILAENILDTEYETFGTFGDAAEIPLRELGYPASDPRFLGPGAPRGIWIGLRFSR